MLGLQVPSPPHKHYRELRYKPVSALSSLSENSLQVCAAHLLITASAAQKAAIASVKLKLAWGHGPTNLAFHKFWFWDLEIPKIQHSSAQT